MIGPVTLGNGDIQFALTGEDLSPLTLPSDWSSTNTVECIGNGAFGSNGTTNGGSGGNGGAYALKSNISGLSGTADFQCLSEFDNGSDTWFVDGFTVLAAGGAGGGLASNSIGDVAYSGGGGAGRSGQTGGGGGAAAGPAGDGETASGSTAGAGAGSWPDLFVSAGSGGDGGVNAGPGGTGGGAATPYGGGGGGGGGALFTPGSGGGSGGGLIVVTYTPSAGGTGGTTFSQECSAFTAPAKTLRRSGGKRATTTNAPLSVGLRSAGVRRAGSTTPTSRLLRQSTRQATVSSFPVAGGSRATGKIVAATVTVAASIWRNVTKTSQALSTAQPALVRSPSIRRQGSSAPVSSLLSGASRLLSLLVSASTITSLRRSSVHGTAASFTGPTATRATSVSRLLLSSSGATASRRLGIVKALASSAGAAASSVQAGLISLVLQAVLGTEIGLGGEQLQDPDCDTGVGWSTAVSGGKIHVLDISFDASFASAPAGNYQVTVVVSNFVDGLVRVQLQTTTALIITGNGVWTAVVARAGASTLLRFTSQLSSTNLDIESASVRPLGPLGPASLSRSSLRSLAANVSATASRVAAVAVFRRTLAAAIAAISRQSTRSASTSAQPGAALIRQVATANQASATGSPSIIRQPVLIRRASCGPTGSINRANLARRAAASAPLASNSIVFSLFRTATGQTVALLRRLSTRSLAANILATPSRLLSSTRSISVPATAIGSNQRVIAKPLSLVNAPSASGRHSITWLRLSSAGGVATVAKAAAIQINGAITIATRLLLSALHRIAAQADVAASTSRAPAHSISAGSSPIGDTSHSTAISRQGLSSATPSLRRSIIRELVVEVSASAALVISTAKTLLRNATGVGSITKETSAIRSADAAPLSLLFRSIDIHLSASNVPVGWSVRQTAKALLSRVTAVASWIGIYKPIAPRERTAAAIAEIRVARAFPDARIAVATRDTRRAAATHS